MPHAITVRFLRGKHSAGTDKIPSRASLDGRLPRRSPTHTVESNSPPCSTHSQSSLSMVTSLRFGIAPPNTGASPWGMFLSRQNRETQNPLIRSWCRSRVASTRVTTSTDTNYWYKEIPLIASALTFTRARISSCSVIYQACRSKSSG